VSDDDLEEETVAISFKEDKEFLFMKNDSFFNYTDIDVFDPSVKYVSVFSFFSSIYLALQMI
jgi:hypothetical protein